MMMMMIVNVKNTKRTMAEEGGRLRGPLWFVQEGEAQGGEGLGSRADPCAKASWPWETRASETYLCSRNYGSSREGLITKPKCLFYRWSSWRLGRLRNLTRDSDVLTPTPWGESRSQAPGGQATGWTWQEAPALSPPWRCFAGKMWVKCKKYLKKYHSLAWYEALI